ncbi:hypothetical protein [Janthinobacterium sp. NKUCC08_JDC]|uniref:hypothetical protein n=1 Tax=Janthinobacterium sp. NKUCC08_JDC TaxID=2842122 RepID=UPI00214B15E1|nr:hypothetical protein [Janthinobacterium sp. NKUCC08_JDC]
MKYLSIMLSLLLLSACSMPLLALAQPGPPPGLPPFLHGIELNEAQQDKVFAATYAHARLEQQLLAVLTPEQRQQAQQLHDGRPGPRHLERAE